MHWSTPDFKSARVHARLTQQELAKRAGITQTRLSRFEAGLARLTPSEVVRVMKVIVEAQREPDALRAQD